MVTDQPEYNIYVLWELQKQFCIENSQQLD